jgi:hypothetical protein
VSPTVLKWRGYRFFFFSREEQRAHVHVSGAEGEVKFWLVPDVRVAMNHGLSERRVSELKRVVEEKRDGILDAWHSHFAG